MVTRARVETWDKQRKANREKQAEKRKTLRILICIALIIFCAGTIFGCIVGSVITTNALADDDYIAERAVHDENAPQTFERTLMPEDDTYAQEISVKDCALEPELQATMFECCKKYEVPFALALAVAEQESRFDPDAVSDTNDYGLMQINECNFEWLRAEGIEPLEVEGNIEAGVLILSKAVKKHGAYNLALMAYNCGDKGAKRLWDKGIYDTGYSKATMERYHKWNACIKGVM